MSTAVITTFPMMMTETPESGNKFLQVGPIKSRIGGGNYIELATLSPADSPKWIKQFLKEFRPDNDDWKNNLKVAKDKCPDNEGGITEETFPFRTYLNILLAAIIFLLISVSTPIA